MDGRMDGWTDTQIDGGVEIANHIGHCPINLVNVQ